MNTYIIKIQNIFGTFQICEWEAENETIAVNEFKELNESYKKNGSIIAVKK